MNDILQRIAALVQASKFDQAVDMIDGLEAQGFTSPQLQVLKGRYLQLGESKKYSVEDAALAFKRAIEIDWECVDAHLELGWFLIRVAEDVAGARRSFEKALCLSTEYSNGARKGLAECEKEVRKG